MPMSSQNTENNLHQANKQGQLPFMQELFLTIEEHEPGIYGLQSITSTGLIQPPASWVNRLFYKYEPNFYGLKARLGDREIHLSSAEILELFSPAYRHPFVQFTGSDKHSEQYLEQFHGAAYRWQQGEFWQEAEIDEDGLKLEGDFAPLLQQAVMQKLQMNAIEPGLLPNLLPFFKDGGWPLTTDRTLDGVKISLRLSEPDETSEEWLLETVLENVVFMS